MDAERKLLCVICPVAEEEAAVAPFYERIARVFEKLPDSYNYNLVFSDNGSQDNTVRVIKSIIAKDPRVFLIALSRNYGYQRSVECGLRTATGDLFQVIDVDCEDPPELILDFIAAHEEGYDIVYGLRADRPEPRWLVQLRKLFYRVTRYVADENFIPDMAEFALITREVRDAIVDEENSFPFVRASVGRVGFSTKGIPYKRERRIAGQTHYRLFDMVVFAVGGILSSSTLLLRIPAYVLPFWAAAMVGLWSLWILSPAPWILPTLLLLGFLFIGSTLTATSIYLARVYKNSLRRPNYVINKKRSVLQLP